MMLVCPWCHQNQCSFLKKLDPPNICFKVNCMLTIKNNLEKLKNLDCTDDRLIKFPLDLLYFHFANMSIWKSSRLFDSFYNLLFHDDVQILNINDKKIWICQSNITSFLNGFALIKIYMRKTLMILAWHLQYPPQEIIDQKIKPKLTPESNHFRKFWARYKMSIRIKIAFIKPYVHN